MDLHWTPTQFWQASVPEFWAAVDFLAERNLDQEEEYEAIRNSTSSSSGGGYRYKAAGLQGERSDRRWSGSLEDAINPNLNLSPRPEWDAWREELRRNTGI